MASEFAFPIGLVHRKIAPGVVLCEALFYPEFARLGSTRAYAGESTQRNLIELIPNLKTEELLRRRRARTAREIIFTLQLDPPRSNEAWREPIELTFHAVVWQQPRPNTEPITNATRPIQRNFVLANVVELGIEVIADSEEDLIAILLPLCHFSSKC